MPTVPTMDVCLLEHLEQLVGSLKTKLVTVTGDIMELEDRSALLTKEVGIENALMKFSLQIKRLFTENKIRKEKESAVSKLATSEGVNLPSINFPTFDGNILNLRTFWEQFEVTPRIN